jgi:hypothetical protein
MPDDRAGIERGVLFAEQRRHADDYRVGEKISSTRVVLEQREDFLADA